jgi:hypothetical protein
LHFEPFSLLKGMKNRLPVWIDNDSLPFRIS